MKNYIKQFTMKKDLYRFAKARANAKPRKYKQIKLTKKAFMFEEDDDA